MVSVSLSKQHWGCCSCPRPHTRTPKTHIHNAWPWHICPGKEVLQLAVPLAATAVSHNRVIYHVMQVYTTVASSLQSHLHSLTAVQQSHCHIDCEFLSTLFRSYTAQTLDSLTALLNAVDALPEHQLVSTACFVKNNQCQSLQMIYACSSACAALIHVMSTSQKTLA